MNKEPYAPLNLGYADHRNVAGLSDAAFRLHTAAILYCNKHLTDGLIEGDEVQRLVRKYRAAALTELVDREMWRPVITSYLIRNYLDWNPSRAEVEKRKQQARDNGAKGGRRSGTNEPSS